MVESSIRSLRRALAGAVLLLAAWAPPLISAEKTAADRAFEAARDAINTRTPDGAKALAAGFAFFLEFPEEPRTRGLLPALAGLGLRLPEAERAAYAQAYDARITAALGRADLPDAAREGILAAAATTELGRQQHAAKPDATGARAKLDALIARYPRSPALAALEIGYGKVLALVDPAAGEAHLTKLAAAADPETARRAGAELKLVQLRTQPLELKFTAADGREVDLAQLRGKVVLIDFWATWCGPCIAELPNLIRVYNAYHEKGFEIVGISFENSGAIDEGALRQPRNAGKALDRPEVVAAKKAAAKEKMLKFTRERKMTWPQHFDGNYWENEFGRRFGINSIPAMFLLDKTGRLVETNARGEKLEPLVKQLLGSGS